MMWSLAVTFGLMLAAVLAVRSLVRSVKCLAEPEDEMEERRH